MSEQNKTVLALLIHDIPLRNIVEPLNNILELSCMFHENQNISELKSAAPVFFKQSDNQPIKIILCVWLF